MKRIRNNPEYKGKELTRGGVLGSEQVIITRSFTVPVFNG